MRHCWEAESSCLAFSHSILEGSFLNYPIIKKVSYEELDTCAALIRESFATVAEQFYLTPQNCPTNGAFIERSWLETEWRKGILMYGLYCDGILAGFMQLEQKAPDICELKKLAVRPEYRHLGYGAMLLSFARKSAIELSAKKITIGIIEENVILKEWYRVNGFVHTGTKRFDRLPFTVGFMEQSI